MNKATDLKQVIKRFGSKAQAVNALQYLQEISPDKSILSGLMGQIKSFNQEVETRVDMRPIKDIFPGAVSIIEYAFTLEGIDYFQFSDFNNMSSDRGFNCLAMFDEMRMGCSPEYIKAFSAALNDIVNNNAGIKITDIVKLNQQLIERHELLLIPDIAYRLCTVVFFDASENPNRFDYKKAAEKAEIFKKKDMADFFLQAPITQLIPHLSSSANDLREYLQMASRINKKHIADISTMLSDASKKLEWYNKLELQNT